MRCRINYQTDPNSLTIIAAEGKEHQYMDKVGHDGLLDIVIMPTQEGAIAGERNKVIWKMFDLIVDGLLLQGSENKWLIDQWKLSCYAFRAQYSKEWLGEDNESEEQYE